MSQWIKLVKRLTGCRVTSAVLVSRHALIHDHLWSKGALVAWQPQHAHFATVTSTARKSNVPVVPLLALRQRDRRRTERKTCVERPAVKAASLSVRRWVTWSRSQELSVVFVPAFLCSRPSLEFHQSLDCLLVLLYLQLLLGQGDQRDPEPGTRNRSIVCQLSQNSLCFPTCRHNDIVTIIHSSVVRCPALLPKHRFACDSIRSWHFAHSVFLNNTCSFSGQRLYNIWIIFTDIGKI